MKKRIIALLVLLVMATQCACAVPAELQDIVDQDFINAIEALAALQEEKGTAGGETFAAVQTEEEQVEAIQAVVEQAEEEADTVDEIIAAYNSNCVEVSAPAKESDVYHPVSIVQCACHHGDCYMVYPNVQNASGADAINSTIQAKVVEQAELLNMPVFSSYKVEYNRNGIFSLRMLIYDLYGDFEKYLACVSMTFDVNTGKLCTLNDFFNSEDQSWRGRIPDLITTQAQNSNMVLLSDILPVADDQPFYITDDAVVITYDLYEIATYSAGEPEFEISVGELAEYIAPDGILNVFLSPEPTVVPEVTASPEPVKTAEQPAGPETTSEIEAGAEELPEADQAVAASLEDDNTDETDSGEEDDR